MINSPISERIEALANDIEWAEKQINRSGSRYMVMERFEEALDMYDKAHRFIKDSWQIARELGCSRQVADELEQREYWRDYEQRERLGL